MQKPQSVTTKDSSSSTRPKVKRRVGSFAALLFVFHATALSAQVAEDSGTTPVVVTVPADYRLLFDKFDVAFAAHRAGNVLDNSAGQLAWLDSYLMRGYVEMYRATADGHYLRRLCDHFDKVLLLRDDKMGRVDGYTSSPLAGWGTARYDRNGKWHVFIVHTAMITMAPAEFVNLVHHDSSLQSEFLTSASAYKRAITECIADTSPYWHSSGPDEGYFTDTDLGLLPLNQMNALGCVLLEMHDVTKEPVYTDQARRMAKFFKNRLHEKDDHYDWGYWPKQNQDETTRSEDISHAALNLDFAVRCARRGIVFTDDDIIRFANTWLKRVRRPDDTWAATVGGTGDGSRYLPSAAGRWLVLCERLPPHLRTSLVADVERAYTDREILMPSQALGLALLWRWQDAAGRSDQKSGPAEGVGERRAWHGVETSSTPCQAGM